MGLRLLPEERSVRTSDPDLPDDMNNLKTLIIPARRIRDYPTSQFWRCPPRHEIHPVSYVAPAREVSIVIGAFIGAKYLKEADGHRRLWAAVAMAAGVIALALG